MIFSLTVSLLVIALTAAATCLGSLLVVGITVVLAIITANSHRRSLASAGIRLGAEKAGRIDRIWRWSLSAIRPGEVEAYLVNSNELNAYTIGILDPKTVVVYSALARLMTDAELSFVLGHELGHIRLGHTVLLNLMAGASTLPGGFIVQALLEGAFLFWRRAGEFSADRAGLLACGDVGAAVSALAKIDSPQAATAEQIRQTVAKLDAEDESVAGIASELISTHPMLGRRIEKLIEYARTPEYARLRAAIWQAS